MQPEQPDLVWNNRRLTGVLAVASIPNFFNLFLDTHLKMFAELGLEVAVATNGRPHVLTTEEFIDTPLSRGPSDLRSHVSAFRTLRATYRRLVKPNEALLVHLHTPIAAAIARLAIPRSLRQNVCVAYMAHGFHFLPGERNKFWRLERLLASRTDLFIVMNSDDERSATDLAASGSASVLSIPGVGGARMDLTSSPRRQDDSKIQLTAIGVLEDRKRPRLAIEALSLLPKSYHLQLYGKGPLDKELKALAKQLGVDDRVVFGGWQADLRGVYESTDVLVFLSKQEGLPMTIVEGVARARPIVAFDIRGVRDILTGLDCWIQPDAITPAAVADAVRIANSAEIDIDAAHTRASMYSLEAAVDVHRKGLVAFFQNRS